MLNDTYELEVLQFGLVKFPDEDFVVLLPSFRCGHFDGIDHLHVVVNSNRTNQDPDDLSGLRSHFVH